MIYNLKYVIGLIIVLVLCTSHIFSYRMGINNEKAKQAIIDISISNAKIEELRKQDIINSQIDSAYIDNQKKSSDRIKTIIKKVPVYVTKEDDSKCIISNWAIKLHNDAINQ